MVLRLQLMRVLMMCCSHPDRCLADELYILVVCYRHCHCLGAGRSQVCPELDGIALQTRVSTVKLRFAGQIDSTKTWSGGQSGRPGSSISLGLSFLGKCGLEPCCVWSALFSLGNWFQACLLFLHLCPEPHLLTLSLPHPRVRLS